MSFPTNSSKTTSPRSPSWVAERDALRELGDRKTRTILAVYLARRSARRLHFFVHPDLAKLYGLSPSDLNWALDRLEGELVETLGSKKGRYRKLRLIPDFENSVGNEPHPQHDFERKSKRASLHGEKLIPHSDLLVRQPPDSQRGLAPEIIETLRQLGATKQTRLESK